MRLFKNILCLTLLFALLAVPAWAEEPIPSVGDCSAYLYQEGSFQTSGVRAAGVNNIETAKRIILEGLRNVDTTIDFRGANVYYKRDIQVAYPEVINEHPDLFYVTGWYSVSYQYDWDLEDWLVITLTPEYNMEVSEVKEAREKYNAELNRILAYASSGSTPLMQAMLVNDYFCTNYQYDLSYSIYDAYSLFTEKTGVCQAYMLGYKAALDALGIPVKTATSDAMNHTWNLVQIDGAWYHVDVTWDDPVPDRAGRARHCYFMRSDAGFQNNAYGNPHYAWVADNGIVASSTRFDDAAWCKLDSPAVVIGGAFYLIQGYNNGEIIAVTGDQQKTIHTFSTDWIITTPQYYGYFYRDGFSVMGYYRNHLIYTVYDEVRALSLKDGSLKTLYTAPRGLGIWEATFDGGVLHYGLGQDYDVITERGNLVLRPEGVEPEGELLVIPEQTTVIEAEAFRGSNVRNLVGCDALETIESLAFAECTNLETVQLGANVAYIADDAFAGCEDVTFLCPEGSYAAGYAEAMGFAVEYKK